MNINTTKQFNLIKNTTPKHYSKNGVSFCANPAKTDINRPIEEMAYREKIEFFKKHNANKDEILYISKQPDIYINRVIYLMRNGADFETAIDIADFEIEEYERAYDLIENEESDTYGLFEIVKLPKREYKKAHHLISHGVYSSSSAHFASLEDKYYIKALKLLKKGVSAKYANKIAHFSEEDFKKAYFLLKNGAEETSVCSLFSGKYQPQKVEEIIRLIKSGVMAPDAINCETKTDGTKEKFLEFQKTHTSQCAGVMANIRVSKAYNDKESIDSISKIVKTIAKNSQKSANFSKELSQFLYDNAKTKEELFELEKYITSIDYKELKSIAPHMINYTNEQLLNFLEWHFANKTETFDKETLDIKEGLTHYLENNHTTAKALNNLLMAHPLTRREVGSIPQDWLENVNDKEKATKEIYKAIKKFQKERKTEELSQDLTTILKKETQVKKLAKGQYGTGYKVSIKNAQPTCLKIFHTNFNNYPSLFHGQNTETQTGLFLNKHSNNFVKMFFGKVSSKYTRDGFLVTQFLSNDTKPLKTEQIELGYLIDYKDKSTDNTINGIIIDYGSVTVRPI